MKAEAAKSAKNPVSVMFAATGINKKGKSNDCIWIGAKNKVKAVKTFKDGKKVHVSLKVTTKMGQKAKKVKAARVFVVDTFGILKKFEKVKYSNIVVKCDGKKVSGVKYLQGYFEPKQNTNSWRLAFYNFWGNNGDTSKKFNAKKFKFKKDITVSFDVTAKGYINPDKKKK